MKTNKNATGIVVDFLKVFRGVRNFSRTSFVKLTTKAKTVHHPVATFAFAIAIASVGSVFLLTQQAHAAVVACTGPNIAFGRQEFCGFFSNLGQNSGDDLKIGGVPGSVDTVEEFITMIETDLNSGSAPAVTAAQFMVLNMIGAPAGSPRSVSAGQLADWKARVRSYANVNENSGVSTGQNGTIEWKRMQEMPCGTINTLYQVAENDVAPYLNTAPNSNCEVPGFEEEYIVIEDTSGNAVYEIRRLCMNPERTLNALALPRMSVGNFVWLDANNDGIVNDKDADYGFNNVNMNLYTNAADTNGDGTLSAAELAAASAAATTTTANDARAGSPTIGKAGYYEFTNLAEGVYFICAAASNFTSGGTLNRYTNSPTPTGVGDTQDDRYDHGDIPTGGTLQTSGSCSSAITLSAFTEPIVGGGNPDDDNNNASDFTIDFGFWHPYSVGNRVWKDINNSGNIDPADGTNPGVGGATVALYDCNGTLLATTTTDSNGYYRFDNIGAGCYQAEVVTTNFSNGAALATCNTSSTGPFQSADPNNGIDSDDNGINPAQPGMAVRTGQLNIGPFAVEPINEADLAVSGQGTDDDFANMTLDFGFTCSTLANTGVNQLHVALMAAGLITIAGVTTVYVSKKA